LYILIFFLNLFENKLFYIIQKKVIKIINIFSNFFFSEIIIFNLQEAYRKLQAFSVNRLPTSRYGCLLSLVLYITLANMLFSIAEHLFLTFKQREAKI